MGGRRVIGFLSLILVILIAFSAYSPWDFLGARAKIAAADSILYDGASCSVSGFIYRKEIKNEKPVYYLRKASLTFDDVALMQQNIILYPDSDDIPNYTYITAYGRVDVFETSCNEGNFDQKNYYNSCGIICAVKIQEITDVKSTYITQFDFLYKLKQAAFEVYNRELPGEEAGFISSIVLGDRGALIGELKDLFSEVGLAHVLAVSGLHISVICMGIYNLLRKTGLSFSTSGVLSIFVAVSYGMLTGGSVSSVRAIGMFVIFIGAQMLGESYDMLTALSVIAVIILIRNPMYITNTGFVFSFGSILSIQYIARPMGAMYSKKCLERRDREIVEKGLQDGYSTTKCRKALEYIIRRLIFSVGLTLGCLPMVASMNYQVPTYSLLLNLILLPLMPYLLGIGLVGGIMGIVVPYVGHIALALCHYIIFVFEMISSQFAMLPCSHIITGKPSAIRVIGYYCILCMIIYSKKLYSLKRKLIAAFVLFVIFVTPLHNGFEIDVMDVGQGDGTFISVGNGDYVFIDGGSSDVKSVGEYRILPFLKYKGVRKIDYWFVSHGDEDHISGLIEAVENDYRIGTVVFSKNISGGESYYHLIELLKQNNIDICYMQKEECFVSGKLVLQCVYSGEKNYTGESNENSLCLLLKYDEDRDGVYDFSGFFGGDISKLQEREIVADGMLTKLDYLKVSHHGSKNSSDEVFVNLFKPRIATISCGRNNSYGHPHKETVEVLSSAGTDIFYTMNSGRIQIVIKRKKIYIDGYKK